MTSTAPPTLLVMRDGLCLCSSLTVWNTSTHSSRCSWPRRMDRAQYTPHGSSEDTLQGEGVTTVREGGSPLAECGASLPYPGVVCRTMGGWETLSTSPMNETHWGAMATSLLLLGQE